MPRSLVVAAGAILLAVHMAGTRDSGKPSTAAGDATAEADLRGAVSVIEQCFSDTSRYPSAIEPTSGVITGCSAQADLGAGSTIAFFPSGGAYILSVTNARDGETGHTYCYSSAHGGGVTAIPAPLTEYRSSC